MYSPSCSVQHPPTPEGWLRIIRKRYGDDFLTEGQEQILLQEGLNALIEKFPDL